MIYVEMHGRLGNQLFQYAFARWLQINTGDEITIRFNGTVKPNEDGWDNSLKYFKTLPYKVYDSSRSTIITKSSLKQKILCLIYRFSYQRYLNKERAQKLRIIQEKWQTTLNKNGIYWIKNGDYEPIVSHNKIRIVNGHFENAKFYSSMYKYLKKEFEPINAELDVNKNLYKNIRTTNSVCISIRRGDFVDNSKNERLYNVCTKEYFYRAIDTMTKLVPNVQFFVFSDDIEWVKDNMHFPIGTEFESGDDPVWEKLRLMYTCKHFIISNSTFSWWAQYLSENEEKVVICPEKWKKDGSYPGLIDDTFIKVQC